MTVDFVFINPNGRNPAPFAAIEPPFWLGLMAGTLQQQGWKQLAIVDAEAENLSMEDTIRRVQGYQKAPRCIVVMGNNPSASSTPKWPAAQRLIDKIGGCVSGLHPTAMKDVRSVSLLKGTPSIPWEMFDLSKYRAHNWHCLEDVDKRTPYGVFYTSLNCPHDCFYCNVHTLYGDRKVRWRPMEECKRELDYFAKKGIRNIKLWDECGFTMNKERAREICDYIIANGYDFNMWCYARLDMVDPVLWSRMWRAGIRWVAYGFESLTDSKSLQNRVALQITRETGINIIANFMFGLPGDTREQMQANFDWACAQNFEFVNFYVALPYPGSAWYDSLKDKPTDWAGYSQFAKKMVYADPELVKWKDGLFRQYISRPEYQKMIGRKFGEKAERHIKEMLQWQITRA